MKRGVRVVVVGISLISLVMSAPALHASGGSGSLWTSGPPVVQKSEQGPPYDQRSCSTYHVKLKVKEFAEPRDVCLMSADHLRIGTLAGSTQGMVIAYPADAEFRRLEGVCAQPGAACVYSPTTDILVTHYSAGTFLSGAAIYSFASQRIQRVVSPDTGGVRYLFDATHPDHTISDEAGSVLPVGAMSLSRNGEWLVVELRNMGIGRINTRTFASKLAVTSPYRYGYGMDPSEELAISNDGSVIAVMGNNAGMDLYGLTDDCGESFVVEIWSSTIFPAQRCHSIQIDPSQFMASYHHAIHPQFDESGESLSFYALSREGNQRWVQLRAAGSTRMSSLAYLALGDSFSSGEGETDDQYYLFGTNEQYDRCHVSGRAYPFLIAQSLNIPNEQVKSIACSGARFVDVLAGVDYWGQGKRLGADGWNLGAKQKDDFDAAAIEAFYPGRVQQERFVERYQPIAITIGVGGNDAGLMDKLKACAMPGTCEWAATPEMIHKVGVEIRSLADRLASTYRSLQAASPLSRLSAIGYPGIMSTEERCDGVTGILFDQQERQFIRESISYLNAVIRSAANEAGVAFIDIEDSLVGGRLCEASSLPTAMNGLRLGDDIAVLSGLPLLKLIGAETFHPNPAGQQLMAQRIVSIYPRLLASDNIAQPPAVNVEADSTYWGQSGDDDAHIVSGDFVMPVHIDETLRKGQIIVPPATFAPNTTVRAEVHSEPTAIGNYISDKDGGLSGAFQLSGDTQEGFHTIHLYGVSFSNQVIDMYQTVSYGVLSAEGSEQALTPGMTSTAVRIEAEVVAQPGVAGIVRNAAVVAAPSNIASVLGGTNTRGQPNDSFLSHFFIVIGLAAGGAALLTVILVKKRFAKNSPRDRGG